ncbi:MAG: hypothetical protein CM15mP4_2070 [Candidatus Neomarinimicrobiota bacterium]|nr:MAG: hypothetical protein CM15mP4_2070 [Candidatus Neomarinimicrobiota bacterium]
MHYSQIDPEKRQTRLYPFIQKTNLQLSKTFKKNYQSWNNFDVALDPYTSHGHDGL